MKVAWRKVKAIMVILILTLIMFIGMIGFQDEFTSEVTAANAIYVDKNGHGNYTSIQAAIDNATAGDTIYVWAGTYYENVVVNKTVSIIGNGSANTTIDGGGTGDVVKITADWVNFSGFRIVNSGSKGEPDYDAGIELFEVENVTIFYNDCSNNIMGIIIKYSKSNFIINNRCNMNENIGILSFFSNTNAIKNNTCEFNQWYGIDSYNSYSNKIINNTCNHNELCGIIIHNSNSDSILNNICNSNSWNGIFVLYSDYNTLTNNICLGNYYPGIRFDYSKFSTAINNTCNSTWDYGVAIRDSISISLLDNKLFSGSLYMGGDKLEYWNTHNIDSKNTIDNKPIYYWKNCNSGTLDSGAGQIILANCKNVYIENQSFYKVNRTITISFSSLIHMYNNIFIENTYGPFLFYSSNNLIYNNIFNTNSQHGLHLLSSSENNITNNTFDSNDWYSIVLELSKNNNIIGNNISATEFDGIYLISSHSNTIFNNNLLYNKGNGIKINNSNQNRIYYNNFINNSNQSVIKGDSKNNLWDNGNGEGNFWSDYKGLDNGAGDRKSNDGIGDTDIPHLGLDHYPFVNKSGWLYPGIPLLVDPGDITIDGNYAMMWYTNRGTSKFELEEDIDFEFKSSTIVYSGLEHYYQIIHKPNGTYYYRLKAFSENHESLWSNVVDIIVDWPPEIPKNLKLTVQPIGNALNISWDTNNIDTIVYELFYKSMKISDWELLESISHPYNIYNHTDLQDGLEYMYKLRALDVRGHESGFSEIVTGIPVDNIPPLPPTGLKIESVTYNSITIVWNANSEYDVEGYNIYRYSMAEPYDWGDKIGTVKAGNEYYLDDDLKELNIYYYVITAFDEVPNESNFSAVISGTTVQGSYKPEINNSVADFSINEDCVDSTTINLYYCFIDLNNDPLIFWCEGQKYINVTIFQENGTVILRPAKNWYGQEKLIFYASDGKLNCSDEIRITINPINDPPDQPRIITPGNLTSIDYGTMLNFTSECNDSDLPDDDLIFKWSSNIQGALGIGKKLVGILLSPGEHQITLTVFDSTGCNSTAKVYLTILESSKPIKKNDDDTYILIGTISGLVIIILILTLIFILFKMRKEKRDVSNATEPTASRFSFLTIRVSDSTAKDQSDISKNQELPALDELKNKLN